MDNYNFPFPEPPWPEKGVVTVDRYALYGLIPKEVEANERAMTLEEQNVGDTGDTLIYETDDRDEARTIYEAGGFGRNDTWYVVTRVVDRVKHSEDAVTFGATHSPPDKRDYDQT
jgi:hypothetical protein